MSDTDTKVFDKKIIDRALNDSKASENTRLNIEADADVIADDINTGADTAAGGDTAEPADEHAGIFEDTNVNETEPGNYDMDHKEDINESSYEDEIAFVNGTANEDISSVDEEAGRITDDEVKVSVIIPVYNDEKYLEECLDSVLNQSLQNIEVICINDGSTDGTGRILDWYKDNDDRVKIISQYNKHAGIARNFGLGSARGKYVIFLDSDDFFDPYMLEVMVYKAEMMNSEICICDARIYDDILCRTIKTSAFLKKKNLPADADVFSYKDLGDHIYDITMPYVWNMLFKREFLILNELMFEDVKRSTSLSFFGEALAVARRITTVNQAFVNYRVGVKTYSESYYNDDIFSEYDSLKEVRKFLNKRGIYDQLETAFFRLVARSLVYVMGNMNADSFFALRERMMTDMDPLFIMDKFRKQLGEYKPYKKLYYNITASREELFGENDEGEEERIYRKYGLKELKTYESDQDRNDNPLVSVIIPAYNVEDYIRECLDSILEQSFEDYEVIVVNDGSIDKTGSIAEAYEEKTNCIKTKKIKHSGRFAARNAGLEMASGKYVKFAEADDILSRDCLAKSMKSIEENEADILYYNIEAFCTVDREQDYELTPSETELREKLLTQTDMLNSEYGRYHNYILTVTGREMFVKFMARDEFITDVRGEMFRRKFLLDNKLWFRNDMPGIDDLFSFHAIMAAEKTCYLDECLYRKRVHGDSVMVRNYTHEEKAKYRIFAAHELLGYMRKIRDEGADEKLCACVARFMDIELNKFLKEQDKISYGATMRLIDEYEEEDMEFTQAVHYVYVQRKQKLKLSREIHKLRNSKSWKITVPARVIRRIVAGNH